MDPGKNITYSYFGFGKPTRDFNFSEEEKNNAQQEEGEGGVRGHSSFCLVGGSKSGKSTIARKLLRESGAIPSQDNKFPLTKAEDLTTHIAQMVVFEGPIRRNTMYDIPAGAQYLTQVAESLLYIDHVVLVVDATSERNGLAQGMKNLALDYKQSIDASPLQIASSMLCKSIIVVVNKLDLVEWSETIYEEMKDVLGVKLQALGFEQVQFVPTGLCDNIDSEFDRSANSGPRWYSGKSLLEMVQNRFYPMRSINTLISVSHSEKPYMNQNGHAEMRCRGRVLENQMRSKDESLDLCSLAREGEFEAKVLWVEHGHASQGEFAEFILIEENLDGLLDPVPLLTNGYYYGPTLLGAWVLVKIRALEWMPTADFQVVYCWPGYTAIGSIEKTEVVYDQRGDALSEVPSKISPGCFADVSFRLDKEAGLFENDEEDTQKYRGVVLLVDGIAVATGHTVRALCTGF